MSIPESIIGETLLHGVDDNDHASASATVSQAPGLDSIANAAAAAQASNPTDIDVIFGRGEPTRKHPGNVVLRNLVRKHLEAYMTSSKSEKSSIIRRVIREIDDSGARYLVPLDTSCRQTIFTGGCREARKSEVRSKVSHAFRDGERQTILGREREGLLVLLHNQNKSGTSSSADNEVAGAALGTHSAHATVNQPQSGSVVVSLTSSAEASGSDNLLSLATILTSMGQSPDPVRQQRVAASAVSNRRNVLPATTVTASNRMNALSSLAASSLSVYPHGPSVTSKSTPSKTTASGTTHLVVPTSTASTKKFRPAVTSPIAASLQLYCQEEDVVFGRGAPLRQHPGNIAFRNTVAKFSEHYLDGTKHRKTEIIQSVIRELEAVGARFLIMNDQGSGVTEATQDEIRMKVSHRFRDFPKSSRGNKKSLMGHKDMMTQEQGINAKSPKKATTLELVETNKSIVVGV